MNEIQTEIKKRKDKKDGSNKDTDLFSKWTREQEALLAEWAEKASCYRWLHGRAEKKYRRSNYAYTIPVIIMSTLTGTANFAMDSFVPDEHKQVAMACVGGVNILAGIISTLQNFLRYAELMESNRTSGISWSKLNRDICVELALDPPRRKPAGDFLNICRAEYDRLIEQSPMIDDSILAVFHTKFHDTDINKPEMCNGLDKCEIYQPSNEEKAATIMSNAASKFTSFRSNISNESNEMKETKKELQGLTKLNKVRNIHVMNIKPPTHNDKQELHSELQGILNNPPLHNYKSTDSPDLPDLPVLPDTHDLPVLSDTHDLPVLPPRPIQTTPHDTTQPDSLYVNDIENNVCDDLTDLDKPSQDFLNAIIDEK